MRIARVQITNFRCLGSVDIPFDDVTTFIGPNGAGKSTVLRALDWFFNGDTWTLTSGDLYSGARGDEQKIEVSVTFDALTDADRQKLGSKYAPPGCTTFTAWRTWDNGIDKITGKALAFPAFEAVRAAQGRDAKRSALEAARAANPTLDLPKWTTIAATDAAMDEWEREHPEHLVDAIVSDTHFFGFNGQGRLSGLFDYVLVTADLRAAEESTDSKTTIIGRILERTVDRKSAQDAYHELAEELESKRREIDEAHLADQLVEVGRNLTDEVAALAGTRRVTLHMLPADLKPPAVRFGVSIVDDTVETAVDRQGHGFQRTLLIAALKLLASRRPSSDDVGVICLAIEEPELFQHPTQARVFARVLRSLAKPDARLQVCYATHSPYFLEPRYFDQVRRVTRKTPFGKANPVVTIAMASLEEVCSRLTAFLPADSVTSRWDQVCLKNLAEAFFADAVVLVEGDDDAAVIAGAAARTEPLASAGITCAATNGKTNMLLPHAILASLDIPTLVVFDNDSGCGERMRSHGRDEKNIEAALGDAARQNRQLARYFHLPEEDFPVGPLSGRLVAVPDTIESLLEDDWPAWSAQIDTLVSQGRGVSGKNAATYGLAAEACEADPTGLLLTIISHARALS